MTSNKGCLCEWAGSPRGALMSLYETYTIRRGAYRNQMGWWISGGTGDTAWSTWKATLAEWDTAVCYPSSVPQWEDVTLGAVLRRVPREPT